MRLRPPLRSGSLTAAGTLLAACAALGAIALAAAPTASAHALTVGSLTITGLWARATPPSAPTAAGYITIANRGMTADRLVSITSPAAGRVAVHSVAIKAGVASMQAMADGLPIPAGGSLTLAPNGVHLMFENLTAPLVQGTEMPVTLTFEKAGTIKTYLHVEGVGAMEPDGD